MLHGSGRQSREISHLFHFSLYMPLLMGGRYHPLIVVFLLLPYTKVLTIKDQFLQQDLVDKYYYYLTSSSTLRCRLLLPDRRDM